MGRRKKNDVENNEEVPKVKKKRGRKPKKKEDDGIVKKPKKRGRKPKGGKIVPDKKIKDNQLFE